MDVAELIVIVVVSSAIGTAAGIFVGQWIVDRIFK